MGNRNGINRDPYYEKFFKNMNYGSEPSLTDPDYQYVKETLSSVPTERLGEFYSFVYHEDKYTQGKGGVVSRKGLRMASVDFMKILQDEIWVDYGLAEKVSSFFSKMDGLVYFANFQNKKNDTAPVSTTVLEDFLQLLDFRKITFSKENSDKQGFDEDEMSIINDYGKENLIHALLWESNLELRETISLKFKILYTNRFFSTKNQAKTIGGSTGGNKPKTHPRVAKLLGGRENND